MVETGQGLACGPRELVESVGPGNPEKAFRSNEYFTKKLTDDEKKATKITEVSFFKIEDIKTASKKEYGYILTLDTNGVIWESYVQSQGFMS